MNLIEEQPAPIANGGRPIWDLVMLDVREHFGGPTAELVLADMRERDRIGRERYGTPLQANNGRNALVDAYQEALDLAVYLRQDLAEDPSRPAPFAGFTDRVYHDAIDLVVRLRALLRLRGEP